MLIFSAFKTLTGKVVTVELKNDVSLTGTLKSVDQFLNFRIDNMKVADGEEARWPHLEGCDPVLLAEVRQLTKSLTESFKKAAVKSAFIRGSVIRYVHIPASAVDTQLLEDATRKEAASGKR